MGKINKEKQAAMPQRRLRELFEYDSTIGSWVWIKKSHPKSTIKVGQVAGTVCKVHGYVQISIDGGRYLAHRLAWNYMYGDYPEGEQPFIDHINGNPSDDRIINLRVSSSATNQRNRKISSNNTSGVNGIGFYQKKRVSGRIDEYFTATWCDKDGKYHQKNFNVGKLGEQAAEQMAITCREEQLHLLELNQDIVYSPRHGT